MTAMHENGDTNEMSQALRRSLQGLREELVQPIDDGLRAAHVGMAAIVSAGIDTTPAQARVSRRPAIKRRRFVFSTVLSSIAAKIMAGTVAVAVAAGGAQAAGVDVVGFVAEGPFEDNSVLISEDDDTTTTILADDGSTTSTSMDDDSTSTSLGDDSTSTSLGGTTATSLDDDGSATTLDDDGEDGDDDGEDGDDDGEDGDDGDDAAESTHAIDASPAGTVTVSIFGDEVSLIAVDPASAEWAYEVRSAGGYNMFIVFRGPEGLIVKVKADADDGQLDVEIEMETDDDDEIDASGMETHVVEAGAAGSVTVAIFGDEISLLAIDLASSEWSYVVRHAGGTKVEIDFFGPEGQMVEFEADSDHGVLDVEIDDADDDTTGTTLDDDTTTTTDDDEDNTTTTTTDGDEDNDEDEDDE